MNGAMKVATEVAEEEFARFVAAMYLEDKLDPTFLDSEDKKSLASAKGKLIRAIERGNLVIDEAGQAVFSPRVDTGGPITFYMAKGSAFLAMDQRKEGHHSAKMIASMADITRQPPQRFGSMPMPDLDVCQAIALLFLG